MLNVIGGGRPFAPGARLTRFDYGGNLGESLQAPVFVPSMSNTIIQSGGLSKEDMQEWRSEIRELAIEQSRRMDRLEVVQVTASVTDAQRKQAKQSDVGTL
jgi:phage baseplate assembly protein W